MGKSSPSPPPAPDPAATARAQAAANREAAIAGSELSMVNQVTPYGSLTYEKTGTSAANNPLYTATTTLSPAQMTLLNQQTQGQTALNQLGLDQLGRINAAVAQPFTYEGMPAFTGSVGSNLPSLQTSLGNTGNIQSSLDFSGAPALMDTTALDAERQRIEGALFQRINPQLAQDRAALETRLANQGITLGSDAYNQAIDEMNRKENDLRLGIVGQGGNELANLFNMSLAGRQNAVGELSQIGQFGNTAQQQMYGQALSSANLANAARAQALNEQISQGQFGNAARGQAIQEQAYARDRPLSEMAAFMSGGQPLMPQFQSTPAAQVAPADVMGATYGSYQGQLNNYNAQLQRQNSTTGALAGLAGSALGGWAMGGFANPFATPMGGFNMPY